eukprot:s2325_g6.t3
MAPPLEKQLEDKAKELQKLQEEVETDMQESMLPHDTLDMKNLAEMRSKKKVSDEIVKVMNTLYYVLNEKEARAEDWRKLAFDYKFAERLCLGLNIMLVDKAFARLDGFFSEPQSDVDGDRKFGDIVVTNVVLAWMRGLYNYRDLATLPKLHVFHVPISVWMTARKERKRLQPRIDQVRKLDGELQALYELKAKDKHWFPIASTLELDPKRPTPVRLDGLDLVVWQVPGEEDSEDGGWRVMSDACPHRLAPLSEGRIEPKTKCLQCAYHGWEFDSKGSCTKIPQVEEAAAQKMRASERSQVPSFPTKVAMKLVWVWLGEGEPEGHPGDILKGSHLESEFEVSGTYTRDLPYGYDSLIENLIDVSHVPFAHHGLQGTRDDAVPVSMTIPEVKSSAEHGEILNFTFWDRTMGMRREAQFSLRSPFFFYYLGEFKGDGDSLEFKKFAERRGGGEADGKPRFRLHCACVPVAPGWSRLILCNATRSGQSGSILPPWAIHLLSNRFLDSDMAFLHYQERKLRNKPNSADGWSNAYYMPGEADRSIGAWRQWLAKEKARCVDPEVELPPSPLSREELLNRWDQHTAYCKHCREALSNMEVVQKGCAALFLAALVGAQTELAPNALCLPVELLGAVGMAGIETLKQEFRFKDYEHYKT